MCHKDMNVYHLYCNDLPPSFHGCATLVAPLIQPGGATGVTATEVPPPLCSQVPTSSADRPCATRTPLSLLLLLLRLILSPPLALLYFLFLFLFPFLLQSEVIPSSSPHTLHTSSSLPPPTLSVSEEKVVDPARGATKPTKRTLGGKTHPLEDSPTNPCNGSPRPTSIIMAFLLRVNSSHTLLNWIYIAHF